MKFEIDSSKVSFNGKGFKSFFKVINDVCGKYNFSYFVIGAFARDIILENIFNEKGGAATKDIDIAIQLESWEDYHTFIEDLLTNHNFTKGRNAHEYISEDGIITDIVPYGDLENNRSLIFPGHTHEINMMGFQEVDSAALNICFDGEVSTKIASIESIVILKLFAWNDRKPSGNSEKHVRDISLIIESYYLSKVAEFAVDFADILDVEIFDEVSVGARALGRRMKQLCVGHNDLIQEITEIFELILNDPESSLFIRQFLGIKNYDFEYSYKILKELYRGFEEIRSQ